MNSKFLVPLFVVLASAALAQGTAQSNPSTTAPKSNPPAAAHGSQQHQEEEGTRVFQQNCSRCHNTPESFSPRISGTVVRHMRVRASLSKHDEEVLLRFLNP
jgi:cytochrome c5